MSQWTWSRDVILKLNFEYKKPHYKQTSIYQHTPIEKTKLWNGWVPLRFLDFSPNKHHVYNVNKSVTDTKTSFEIDKITSHRAWRQVSPVSW